MLSKIRLELARTKAQRILTASMKYCPISQQPSIRALT